MSTWEPTPEDFDRFLEHAGGSLAALAAHLGPRTRRAAAWAAVATSVWRAAARGVAEWDHRRSWRVSVEDGDALYELALAWVAAQLPPGRRRALIAATERVGEITPGSPDGRSWLAVRFLHDPLARPVTVSVDGHAVRDASPAELVEALRATMGGSAGERWAAVQSVVE